MPMLRRVAGDRVTAMADRRLAVNSPPPVPDPMPASVWRGVHVWPVRTSYAYPRLLLL